MMVFGVRPDEDRNTWEPWENLLEPWVQERAREVRDKAA